MTDETAADDAPEAAETPAEETAPETTEAAPAPAEAPEEALKPEPHKPSAVDRRIAQLTARLAAEGERAAKAMRDLEALKAMLPKDGEKPAELPRNIEAEIDRAADMKLAQRQHAEATRKWLTAGRAEFADFDDKSGVLASLGATEKPAFLEAVVGLPNGHKLVPMLADDPDEALRILDLPPLRMAAELGRLAEKASAAPKPKSVSNAPAPVTPVSGRARKEWNLSDADIPIAEFIKIRNKQEAERRKH